MANVICIIPARWGSSRFEGKPLADICGKPMIQHVYEKAAGISMVSYVAVATDDTRIFDRVKELAQTLSAGGDLPKAITAKQLVLSLRGETP